MKKTVKIRGLVIDAKISTNQDVEIPDLSEEENDIVWLEEFEEILEGPGGDELYILNIKGSPMYIYMSQGHPESAEITKRPPWKYLLDCESGDMDSATWLSNWGIDPLDPGINILREAKPGEPCKIWVKYNYYIGHLPPKINHFLVGENPHDRFEEPLEFSSREKAERFIKENLEIENERLQHGQAGSDEYIPVVFA